jgi:hypothetical protein
LCAEIQGLNEPAFILLPSSLRTFDRRDIPGVNPSWGFSNLVGQEGWLR